MREKHRVIPHRLHYCMLLELGIKLCVRDLVSSGSTALHLSAFRSHIRACELLLQFGADVNAKDKK
jgi:ankyrin repeat protein